MSSKFVLHSVTKWKSPDELSRYFTSGQSYSVSMLATCDEEFLATAEEANGFEAEALSVIKAYLALRGVGRCSVVNRRYTGANRVEFRFHIYHSQQQQVIYHDLRFTFKGVRP